MSKWFLVVCLVAISCHLPGPPCQLYLLPWVDNPAARHSFGNLLSGSSVLRALLMPCSTLDPVLRMEQQGVTPQGLAIILAILAYLFAKPGDTAVSSQ